MKRDKRFTVVIGNPPYSNFGQLNLDAPEPRGEAFRNFRLCYAPTQEISESRTSTGRKAMPRHWAIGLVAAAIGLLLSWSAAAAPSKSSPPADAPYRFVGYSSSAPADLVAGGVGLPDMYAACQELFGPV